jgi:hypothetical protein
VAQTSNAQSPTFSDAFGYNRRSSYRGRSHTLATNSPTHPSTHTHTHAPEAKRHEPFPPSLHTQTPRVRYWPPTHDDLDLGRGEGWEGGGTFAEPNFDPPTWESRYCDILTHKAGPGPLRSIRGRARGGIKNSRPSYSSSPLLLDVPHRRPLAIFAGYSLCRAASGSHHQRLLSLFLPPPEGVQGGGGGLWGGGLVRVYYSNRYVCSAALPRLRCCS